MLWQNRSRQDSPAELSSAGLQRSFADRRVMPVAAPMSAHQRPSRRALATVASSCAAASSESQQRGW